ncbi:amidohydrolase family protein, partial [Flavitalea sp.]|nr:hypothetical protein [Flavitalea sp.]
MAKTIFTNIKKLVNCRTGNQLLRRDNLAILPCIDNAYLLIEDDKIIEYGPMDDCPTKIDSFEAGVVNVSGQYILPAWCDSHTHLVFAGSRENEFVEKIQGLTYAEIAAKGGGILNSARILSETPEDILFASASSRLKEIALQGTGAVEIKSGYGLTVDAELKMLRVIQRLKNESPMIIRSTFLGAHTYPAAFKDDHEGYINLIINEMLPVIASENLA